MKKRIISLSLILGLFMCTGLYSANKHMEVENSVASINNGTSTIRTLGDNLPLPL